MDVIDKDVLVIGGGNAGLRAAIEASGFPELSVAVASKSMIPGGASVMSAGVFNVVGLGPEPATIEDIFNDTIIYGDYLNDQRMVRTCLEEGSERVMELERFGAMQPRRETDQYYFFDVVTPGTSKLYRFKNRYAWQVARALQEEAIERGVEFYPEVMITSVQTSSNGATGATGIDMKRGEFVVFRSNSVVIATGGGTSLYKRAYCDTSSTGDGYAMAFKVGAELANMEFVQWIWNTNLYPPALEGRTDPVTALELALGGDLTVKEVLRNVKFVNVLGERFMERYDPVWMEMATDDVLCVAIFNEVRQRRGTKKGGILMDLTEVPKEINYRWRKGLDRHWSEMLHQIFDEEELRWEKPLEVGPAAIYSPGGIKINLNGETNIPGLYAVGAASCGMHGTAYLAGNCLGIDTLAMGKRTGETAARHALKKATPKIDWNSVDKERKRVFAPLEREEGESTYEIKTYIQNLMFDKVGIIRNEKGLKEAIQDFQRLNEEVIPRLYTCDKHQSYNIEWKTAIEVQHMCLCAEIMARSALFRTESRGGCFREDFPKRDNANWCVQTGIQLKRGGIKIYTIPLEFVYLEPGDIGWKEDWLPKMYPEFSGNPSVLHAKLK